MKSKKLKCLIKLEAPLSAFEVNYFNLAPPGVRLVFLHIINQATSKINQI